MRTHPTTWMMPDHQVPGVRHPVTIYIPPKDAHHWAFDRGEGLTAMVDRPPDATAPGVREWRWASSEALPPIPASLFITNRAAAVSDDGKVALVVFRSRGRAVIHQRLTRHGGGTCVTETIVERKALRATVAGLMDEWQFMGFVQVPVEWPERIDAPELTPAAAQRVAAVLADTHPAVFGRHLFCDRATGDWTGLELASLPRSVRITVSDGGTVRLWIDAPLGMVTDCLEIELSGLIRSGSVPTEPDVCRRLLYEIGRLDDAA